MVDRSSWLRLRFMGHFSQLLSAVEAGEFDEYFARVYCNQRCTHGWKVGTADSRYHGWLIQMLF